MSRLDYRIGTIGFNPAHGTRPVCEYTISMSRLMDRFSTLWAGPSVGTLGEAIRVVRSELGQEHVK